MTTMKHEFLYRRTGDQSAHPVSDGIGHARRDMPTRLLAALLVAAALLMAACGSQPGATSNSPSGQHGLPGNIPLPDNATFVDQKAGDGLPDHEWVWTLASPNNPHTAQQFYQNNLPRNGWTIARSDASDPAGGVAMIGCQGNQEVDILLEPSALDTGVGTITAPSGGSVLDIQTLHGDAAKQNGCGS